MAQPVWGRDSVPRQTPVILNKRSATIPRPISIGHCPDERAEPANGSVSVARVGPVRQERSLTSVDRTLTYPRRTSLPHERRQARPCPVASQCGISPHTLGPATFCHERGRGRRHRRRARRRQFDVQCVRLIGCAFICGPFACPSTTSRRCWALPPTAFSTW